MKKHLIFVIVLICIIGLGLVLYSIRSQSTHQTTVPTPTSGNIPTKSVTEACTQNDLTITLNQQGAAGSIYGDITVTNTSSKSCTVLLGNTISLLTTAKNISSKEQRSATSEPFQLAPDEKLYSQVRIPNSPQCMGGVTPKDVTFQYSYQDTKISFQPVQVQACTSASDQTVIDIWPLSKTPITQ